MDVAAFRAFFARCERDGNQPYEYQERVAARLFEGRHLEVWAPTGAGKTLAVLAPFLWQWERGGPRRWDRLIYVLPLRSLVESIAVEAEQVVQRLGLAGVEVAVQTGERPDDPFFDRGQVIVATFDQVLSGALNGPYGLPEKLHNVNAAAVAGALVTFDEYHLMGTGEAFLTAVAHLALYRRLCQSVWMTATATEARRAQLRDALGVESLRVEADQLQRVAAVAEVKRQVIVERMPLEASAVLGHHRQRSIALCNTVERANRLYDEIVRLAQEQNTRGPLADVEVLLLHARFLPRDRKRIEARVRNLFARGSQARAILVCTQVIEAGMNITCDVLHTEVAPLSALVQRAGRCARFAGEVGAVRVYPLPDDGPEPWRPYEQDEVAASLQALTERAPCWLEPDLASDLVERVHGPEEARRLEQDWRQRQSEVLQRAYRAAVLRKPDPIADLIRSDDGQTIRVVVARQPGSLNPYAVEGFGLRRGTLARLFDQPTRLIGWRWTPDQDLEWSPLESKEQLWAAFAVCLHPAVAHYGETVGLRLGQPGQFESPPRERPERQRTGPLRRESWSHHAAQVAQEAEARVGRAGAVLVEGLAGEPWCIEPGLLAAAARAVGLLHDVGKLQVGWQRWAEEAMRRRDSSYVHCEPLAHTDYDPNDPADRARERALAQLLGRRPPHAAASAHYGFCAALALLRQVRDPAPGCLLAACLAAILGHHGGWLVDEPGEGRGVQPLVPHAAEALKRALPAGPSLSLAPPPVPLQRILEGVVADEPWPVWWPVVALLTRVLRLADQRATSLYGQEG